MNAAVSRIISGGQTGADRAALEAAKYLRIKTGGHCPRGYKTEAGVDTSLKQFGLKQTQTDNPSERTILNVKNSDGTVIFGRIFKENKVNSPGTLLTLNTLKEYSKPYLLNPSRKQFLKWLKKYNIKTLNIAGSRLSEDHSIYSTVYSFLIDTLGDDVINKFRNSISEIVGNDISGSKELLMRLISALARYLKNNEQTKEESYSLIKKELEPFTKGKFSEMKIISNFVKELITKISKNPKADIMEYINGKKNNLIADNKRLIDAAIKTINLKNKALLLISNSYSITSLFKRLSKRKTTLKIIQCKSNPGGEGRLQAASIKSYGFKVRLIDDNDFKKYLTKTDIALLGCDAYNDKYFSNKTGSLEIARAFYSNKKPVYVLADKAKYSRNFHKEKNLSGMFDVIPLSYVTKIIQS